MAAHLGVTAQMQAQEMEGEGNTLGTGGLYPRVPARDDAGYSDIRYGSPGLVVIESWMRVGDDGGEPVIGGEYAAKMAHNIEQHETKLRAFVERCGSSSIPNMNNSVRCLLKGKGERMTTATWKERCIDCCLNEIWWVGASCHLTTHSLSCLLPCFVLA